MADEVTIETPPLAVTTPGVPATEKDGGIKRDENGRPLPGQVLNPSGKGGFQDHPELRNPGGRPKNQESFAYWMNYFKNLPITEFLAWQDENPESERTVAADIAYTRVFNSRKDLEEFKVVADRTEGRAPQTLIHEGGFFTKDKLIVEIVDGTGNDENQT